MGFGRQFKLFGGIATLGAFSFSIGGLALAEPTEERANINDKQQQIAQFEGSVRALRDRANKTASAGSIMARMAERNVPGAAVAIVQNGEIIHSAGYGLLSARSDEQVDEKTVFSAGSVSKVVNAVLILRLVQAGLLDLDEDVNSYLTSWKVPSGTFTRSQPVTLRHLLSHTSGFSQHGFPDFKPGQPLPTTVQTLDGIKPAKNRPVRLMFEPGKMMDYSGGGITVAQLVAEDVLQKPYEAIAREYLFDPLGMDRSTFANPLPETYGNIAKAHSKRGKLQARPRGYESMPELAASGLWTSSADMALFLKVVLTDDEFLTPAMRAELITRAPRSWHGMGPRINGDGDNHVFHHGGANDHYMSWLEGHPASKNGMIILTNSEAGRELGYELRIAAGEAFGWAVQFPQDFGEPKFQNAE